LLLIVITKFISDSQGGSSILKRYKGSFTKALIKLYPELTFERENFLQLKGLLVLLLNYYFNLSFILLEGKKQQYRTFFDNFACSKNFDPLDAAKWYSVTQSELMSAVRLRFSM
jgi:hypothetical protein